MRGNFQGDKDAKEAAKRSTVSRERESISIESAKKQAKEEPKEDTAIDLSIFKKDEPGPKAEPVIEEPAAVEKPLAENPVVEKAPASETSPEPVIEKPAAEEATSEKQVEKQKPTEDPAAKVGGLKVVGKVDFQAQKKEAAEKRAAAAEARAKAKLESEKIVVKSAIQPIETTQSKAEDQKDDSNVVKAKADQLSGPKVVGKIELPVEKPKKSSDGEKRKREYALRRLM